MVPIRHSWRANLAGCIAAGLLGASSAAAEQGAADVPVDVELVLAVDVSLSMSPMELDIQRDGYAAALRHEKVIAAIRDGVHGRIAVTYVEWAGDTTQHVIVPWRVISNASEADDFAAALTAEPPRSARRTSISGGLLFSAALFEDNGFRGMKRVIDISGDGPNNQGPEVASTRDRIVETGIVINGLPLMTNGGYATGYDVKDLDRYYAGCVIGGPGSFMIPVNDWSQFPEAIRRKLVLELAEAAPDIWSPGNDLPVLKASYADDAVDCLIGEKMWQNRSRFWEN